ncbi:hypothetical protein BCF33_1847 [Hasllibacter halocynthiae]|uniref:Uncharacterized protein n=1 Tax=Hasllibacter halocynthiae TaxID=595589 RepID=A0A2T0X201_9RHOB|nr:hypothetical protein [Hasllibacter halocynthiae]PRY92983.1 hypothetical protein BCF33_1847 [Hasllibacter halocynthiae]
MSEVLWTIAVLFGAIGLAGAIAWGATGRYRREARRGNRNRDGQ